MSPRSGCADAEERENPGDEGRIRADDGAGAAAGAAVVGGLGCRPSIAASDARVCFGAKPYLPGTRRMTQERRR